MLRLQAPLPDRYTQATPEELDARIGAAKAELGPRLLVLGHHYQRPEVIRWADARGDSFKLAQFAAQNGQATDIVFCGVHFMAESADILTGDHQRVVLPDLNAGCSMADMANLDQVEEAWEELGGVIDVERIMPITYMNSSAALKAFVGEHGGAVCTSSNARIVLEWAFARADKVLFFPDQHLGRNTGYEMGYTESHMRVWDPRRDLGGLDERDAKEATFLLWKGHCTVHQRFRPEHVDAFRAAHPDGRVLVHPECAHEVVALADHVGSTERIVEWVDAAPPGATLGVATEIHMVQRLAADHPDKTVVSLDPLVCPCSTMFRIDGPHLAWCLEALAAGEVVNQIRVDERTARGARVALQRMLDLPGVPSAGAGTID
jgi:quinolinate synthase